MEGGGSRSLRLRCRSFLPVIGASLASARRLEAPASRLKGFDAAAKSCGAAVRVLRRGGKKLRRDGSGASTRQKIAATRLPGSFGFAAKSCGIEDLELRRRSPKLRWPPSEAPLAAHFVPGGLAHGYFRTEGTELTESMGFNRKKFLRALRVLRAKLICAAFFIRLSGVFKVPAPVRVLRAVPPRRRHHRRRRGSGLGGRRRWCLRWARCGGRLGARSGKRRGRPSTPRCPLA